MNEFYCPFAKAANRDSMGKCELMLLTDENRSELSAANSNRQLQSLITCALRAATDTYHTRFPMRLSLPCESMAVSPCDEIARVAFICHTAGAQRDNTIPISSAS